MIRGATYEGTFKHVGVCDGSPSVSMVSCVTATKIAEAPKVGEFVRMRNGEIAEVASLDSAGDPLNKRGQCLCYAYQCEVIPKEEVDKMKKKERMDALAGYDVSELAEALAQKTKK